MKLIERLQGDTPMRTETEGYWWQNIQTVDIDALLAERAEAAAALAEQQAQIERLTAEVAAVDAGSCEEDGCLRLDLSGYRETALGWVKSFHEMKAERDALRAEIKRLRKPIGDDKFTDDVARAIYASVRRLWNPIGKAWEELTRYETEQASWLAEAALAVVAPRIRAARAEGRRSMRDDCHAETERRWPEADDLLDAIAALPIEEMPNAE